MNFLSVSTASAFPSRSNPICECHRKSQQVEEIASERTI